MNDAPFLSISVLQERASALAEAVIACQPCAHLRLVNVLIKVDTPSFVGFWHDLLQNLAPAVKRVHVLQVDVLAGLV